ncbi:MAG: glucoamylase family protein, partial [Telluria sp.]
MAYLHTIEDMAELAFLQRESFRYFLDETNPANGLVRDKNAPGWPASIAAVGMALLAYPVAVERGFIARDDALATVLTTLRFFWNSPQGPQADATGHHGFYYHFLDMETGRRARQCELSTIDSAWLLAGALGAARYFGGPGPDEQEIGTLADALYRRAHWQWAQNKGDTVTMGWKSGRGFLKHRWTGYNEALLVYILGLGSPTFPLPVASYHAWCASYHWESCYGIAYLHSGSLFTHQLSHIWIDFRGIQDAFMRAKGIDYFENSRRATQVQQLYAIANPRGFSGYGEHCWGLTASDGPGPATRVIDGVKRRFYDYIARGVPCGPDDGTIAPWAVIASLPFAPDIVLPTIRHLATSPRLHGRYGFKTTFNATWRARGLAQEWVSPWHFGIDQGPVFLMIEN